MHSFCAGNGISGGLSPSSLRQRAACISGRAQEGLALLQEALSAMEAMRFTLFHSFTMVNAGEASLVLGLPDDAIAYAQRALTLSCERGERGFQAWALRLLGEARFNRDPADREAESHIQAALALAKDLGMRPLVAHCHLGLGTLYRRTDKREHTHEHFATATMMYRDMGMAYWLEKAQAEVRELQ